MNSTPRHHPLFLAFCLQFVKRGILRSLIPSRVEAVTGILGISFYIKNKHAITPPCLLRGGMHLVDWFLHPFLNLRSWLDLRFNRIFYVFCNADFMGIQKRA